METLIVNCNKKGLERLRMKGVDIKLSEIIILIKNNIPFKVINKKEDVTEKWVLKAMNKYLQNRKGNLEVYLNLIKLNSEDDNVKLN